MVSFGMQWKYLFRQLDGTDGVTLGYVMLILLFDFFLFLLIAIYLDAVRPGKSGMPKKWNYLCQRSYWTSDYEKMPETETNEDTGDPENFEDEPENVPIGINIKHLSKKFGSHEAVKDLNLRVYDGQITVLLGHNGAGKTTTMSMVTGLFIFSMNSYRITAH
ncbi:ATP-binding cassette sub-family A member 3 [Blattella germanica]|nr:ATP-binding cassette sub-family A member 3 [Blattella germanica]